VSRVHSIGGEIQTVGCEARYESRRPECAQQSSSVRVRNDREHKEVLSWDSDRRLAQIESMRSLNGVGKARYGPAIRRSGDEIQTGGCEVGPENRAAGVVGAVGAETEGL
jgi:hypothetical protein